MPAGAAEISQTTHLSVCKRNEPHAWQRMSESERLQLPPCVNFRLQKMPLRQMTRIRSLRMIGKLHLYRLAYVFQNEKPWEHVPDEAMYAVQHADGSISYCTFNGSEGNISLFVFTGTEELASFFRCAISMKKTRMNSRRIHFTWARCSIQPNACAAAMMMRAWK